jgi:hypothetical protein
MTPKTLVTRLNAKSGSVIAGLLYIYAVMPLKKQKVIQFGS